MTKNENRCKCDVIAKQLTPLKKSNDVMIYGKQTQFSTLVVHEITKREIQRIYK